ncbi:hypothetical protein [Paenibacillus ginsengarvi]|uniref:Uncharacterized protein n=1 Tax=Paenibacillus ginsengarvi TaxID=400777 RepID=A0A3B0BDC4_9BACL|nr:hypothetical protein [Paenibacillus ginsengarvi]RKN70067.1 hypothetical protein D7M11_31070 [Paenibacillus ginsengarvi]
MRKRVAVIITQYWLNSHADVIVSRLLGELGYKPQVELVAMYVEQVTARDLSREQSVRHGVPICATIEEAVAWGAPERPVDGVVVIGEHGDYPWNEKQQHLYPRLRFMQETLAAMDLHGIRVPIFLDKHFSYNNTDARWIYDEVKRRGIPFMAGSSIPYTDYLPHFDRAFLQRGRIFFINSHGGHESYGFHGMEVLQALAEHRLGAELGVASVHALSGDEMWQAMDRGEWPEALMLRALALEPELAGRHPRKECPNPALFVVTYQDGTMGYVAQLDKFATRWSFAVQDDEGACIAAYCNTGTERPYRHFTRLTEMIEEMIINGTLPCRIERNLLTTFLINSAMESLYLRRPLSLEEWNVAYDPAPNR